MYFIIGTIIVLGIFLPAPIATGKMRWNAYKGTHRIINAIVWSAVQALSQVASVRLFVGLVSTTDEEISAITMLGMCGVMAIAIALPFACFVMLEKYRKVQVTVTR